MPIAIVRPPADCYDQATRKDEDPAIDLESARGQHKDYVRALQACGVEVIQLPAGPYPDGVFVEDQAVIFGRVALMTRSGHLGRRAEQASVQAVLVQLGLDVRFFDGFNSQPDHPVSSATSTKRKSSTKAPATVDGGDVLITFGHLFVGVSARTNAAGASAMASAGRRFGLESHVIELPSHLLHLKCVCSGLPDGRVLLAENAPFTLPSSSSTLDESRLVWVPAQEAYAANVVSIPPHHVIVPAGFPRTHKRLAQAGYKVKSVDISEYAKGDGAMTCLSLRMLSLDV